MPPLPESRGLAARGTDGRGNGRLAAARAGIVAHAGVLMGAAFDHRNPALHDQSAHSCLATICRHGRRRRARRPACNILHLQLDHLRAGNFRLRHFMRNSAPGQCLPVCGHHPDDRVPDRARSAPVDRGAPPLHRSISGDCGGPGRHGCLEVASPEVSLAAAALPKMSTGRPGLAGV